MSEAAVTEFSAATKKLGDEIVKLTLKEAKELSDYLKDVHGIEPAAGGGVMMAAGDGGGGGARRRPKSRPSSPSSWKASAIRRSASSRSSARPRAWASRKPRTWSKASPARSRRASRRKTRPS